MPRPLAERGLDNHERAVGGDHRVERVPDERRLALEARRGIGARIDLAEHLPEDHDIVAAPGPSVALRALALHGTSEALDLRDEAQIDRLGAERGSRRPTDGSSRGEHLLVLVDEERLDAARGARRSQRPNQAPGHRPEARAEIEHWRDYDYVIINKDLQTSLEKARAILYAERMRRARDTYLESFVAGLLAET